MMELAPIIIIFIIIVLLIRKASKKATASKAKKAAAKAAEKTVTKADHTTIRVEPKKPEKTGGKKAVPYPVSPETGKLHIKMQEEKPVVTAASGGGYTPDAAIIYAYDHSFAKAQGMWTCSRCETMNAASERLCCVCGRVKD